MRASEEAGTTAASARRHLKISRGFVPSDVSALSITEDRRDLVPFRTTTSYSELKIHNTNVAAGDFGDQAAVGVESHPGVKKSPFSRGQLLGVPLLLHHPIPSSHHFLERSL